MKKNLFKLLSLLLALCLILCACGDSSTTKDEDEKEKSAETTAAKTPEETTEAPEIPTTEAPVVETAEATPPAEDELIVGTWKTEMDFGGIYDMLFEMLLGEEIAEYLNFDGLMMTAYYTFEDDGTYTMVIEEEDLEIFAEEFVEMLTTSMYDLMEDMLAEELGGKTLEEYLKEQGVTFEDLLAEIMEMDLDTLADTMLEAVGDTTTTGEYAIADGVLTFDGEEQPVELDLDVMVVYAPEGEYDEATQAMVDSMYPMEFVRVR